MISLHITSDYQYRVFFNSKALSKAIDESSMREFIGALGVHDYELDMALDCLDKYGHTIAEFGVRKRFLRTRGD